MNDDEFQTVLGKEVFFSLSYFHKILIKFSSPLDGILTDISSNIHVCKEIFHAVNI